jgi:hypothetical protein
MTLFHCRDASTAGNHPQMETYVDEISHLQRNSSIVFFLYFDLQGL